MQKEFVKTIVFDLDGTLFQSEIIAVPAFHDTMLRLQKEGLYPDPIPDDETLKSMFGKTNDQIWAELLPGATFDVVEKADQYMLYYELQRLHLGEGRPYPEVIETLLTLKEKGYRLCIASNGGEGYVTGVANYHFPDFFEEVYSAGGYQTRSKVDLVRLIVERFSDGHLVMVGDRNSDIEAGRENNLTTIGCNYGFGPEEELKDADHIITKFSQILEFF